MTNETKASHTPSPWKYRPLVHDGKRYSTLYECHIDLGPCMIWAPEGNLEQEANARLIAAAPDLLEACKVALNFVDDVKVQKQVIAVIEKATGD